MKKRIFGLLLLLCLALPLLFSCGTKQSDVPSGFQLASDDEVCSYRLYVPENWAVKSEGKTDFTMTTVPCDTRCSLSVAVISNFPEGTVDEFFAAQKSEYDRIFDTVTVEEEGKGAKIALGGTTGFRYQFDAVRDGKEYRFMQIYIPRSEGLSGYRYYLITYTADKAHFDTHYDNEANTDVLAVLEHFAFK